MPSKQFILRLKFTVTLSSFQPRELIQEHLVSTSLDRLWFTSSMKIGAKMEALNDHAAYRKRKIVLKEFFLFELKKTADGGEALQPVIYWIIGNEIMPEYDVNVLKKYFKKYFAQKHPLTAIVLPPVKKQ